MNTLEKEILHELRVYPLVPTNYHRKLGCGTCHTFGLIPRRGGTPEMSAISFERARLYKLLCALADEMGIQDYTSISVQHNYTLTRRKEKQGGKAHIVLLGSYQDTGIRITGAEGIFDTQRTVRTLDTAKECICPSVVSSGDRYLVLYHTLANTPYERPEFFESNGNISVRCGEATPLPRGRGSFVREMKEVKIVFD